MRLTGGRKWAIALLYVVALTLAIEGAGYLIVRAYDNDLGNRSQRHLHSAIRGHELISIPTIGAPSIPGGA
jgi:hypothetical protein